MNEKNKWLILTVPCILLLLGFTSYFMHFNGKVSSNAQDWGSFGSYINSFIALCNVALFVMFSFLLYKYNRSINNPILTFKTEDVNGEETWQIINIGNGPALNLLVSYKTDKTKDWISPSVKSYSLGKNDKVNLDWLTYPDVIGVHYKDIFDNEFIAIVGDDITEVRPFKNFKEVKINDHLYTRSDFEKLLELDSVRITRARNKKRNTGESGTSGTSTTSATTTHETTKL